MFHSVEIYGKLMLIVLIYTEVEHGTSSIVLGVASSMLDEHNLKQTDEFEFHPQIGSNLYPEYRIQCHAEALYQLKKHFRVRIELSA